MRVVSKIIVHCTATPEDIDYGIEQARDYHVNHNGWSDVGYHWLIRRSGVPEVGRPEEKAGAHAKGHNADSIGVALEGTSYFTETQFMTLAALCVSIDSRYNVGLDSVYGHYEFTDKKTCPNIDMNRLRRFIWLASQQQSVLQQLL